MAVKVKFEGKQVFIDGVKARRVPGDSRLLYMTPLYVLKKDTRTQECTRRKCYGCSRHQSKFEAKKWKTVKREDKRFFAPVLASGRDWVLQRRLYGRKRAPAWAHHEIQHVIEKYDISDIRTYPDRTDYTVYNWMMTPKGPVIFDYAI